MVDPRFGLLLEHFLQVADFTLYLPACFFHCAAIAQVWIPYRLAGLFFDFALRFLESALDLILCARFHKNKIARYVHGGCNLIWNQGERQTVKQNKSKASRKSRDLYRLLGTTRTPISDASPFFLLCPPRPASEVERMFTERRGASRQHV